MQNNETILGIDFPPATGELYAVVGGGNIITAIAVAPVPVAASLACLAAAGSFLTVRRHIA